MSVRPVPPGTAGAASLRQYGADNIGRVRSELDEVNGGFIFLALGLVAAFEVGFLGGVIAANYSETGNFWGDI